MNQNRRRKKIIYVLTKSNWGGAQRYVYDLATRISGEIFEPVVVAGGEGTLLTKLSGAGVRTITIPHLVRDIGLLREIRSWFALFRIFRAENPDIVHLNSSKAAGLGALAARIARVPKIVFTVHGWPFNEERTRVQKALIALFSWLTVALSHETITLSSQERLQGAAMPLVWKKIRLVHNGIPALRFIEKSRARAMLAGEISVLAEKDTLWFGAVGELHRNKGLSYAIEAFAEFKKRSGIPCVFAIIGSGEEERALRSLAEQKGISRGSVLFAGYRENAYQLFKAFDVLLLSSTKEGFPYVLLEAGNAGLPVIATAVGGVPDIIDDMRTGILVRPKNAEEIVHGMVFLADNPKKRKQLGAALKEKISTRFSLEEMVRETLRSYRNIP